MRFFSKKEKVVVLTEREKLRLRAYKERLKEVSEIKVDSDDWKEFQEYLHQGEEPKKSRCIIL